MDKNEKVVRNELANILGNISEKALCQISPFDKILQVTDHNYLYSSYLQLIDELTESDKKKILESIIKKSRLSIESKLLGKEREFHVAFPLESDVIKDFFSLIEEKKLNVVKQQDVLRIFGAQEKERGQVFILDRFV